MAVPAKISPMSGLPPRHPRNQRDKDAYRDWVCDQLDLIVSPPTKFEIPKDLDAEKLQLLKYRTLAEAISGDVTKLKQLVSHLLGHELRRFHSAKAAKKRPKRISAPGNLSWVIVSLIKQIWRKHYKTRRYRLRGQGEGYSDAEIAAHYLGIPEENAEEIVSKNPLLRRKKKPRKKNLPRREKKPRKKITRAR